MSQIRLRPRARRDVEEAVSWYLSELAFDAADGFVAATEEAFLHLSTLEWALGTSKHPIALDLGWERLGSFMVALKRTLRGNQSQGITQKSKQVLLQTR